MLEAKKADAASERTRREHWSQQCQALDRQIDQIVYKLYSFTG